MKTFLSSFLISFSYLIFITPLLIYAGKKFGLVAEANRRNIHKGSIPRIGGIGIATGTLFPLLCLYIYNNAISQVFFSDIANSIVIIGCGLAISLLGFIDDIRGVRARYKFVFQILMAIVAWYFGFGIGAIITPWGVLEFGLLSLPITVLWIVGVINAFNLIDGLDGLSSGIAFFVSITLLILSIYNGKPFVALISAAMAGAVVGFLFYNFNPAKIFMGDSGSMFLGFILGVLSLKGASKGSAIVSLLIPIMAMGLPILDTSLAFVRRFMRNQPIFLADRQHIHHILLSKGLNQRKVVFILYGISLLFTLLALGSIFVKDKELFLMMLVFGVIVIVIITKLGYMDLFYGKYILKREKTMEEMLEKVLVERIASMPLKDMEDLIYSLPIKGFSIIEEKGAEIFLSGEKDKINSLDIAAEKECFLRLYWIEAVPTINSREAVMLKIIAKAILNYINHSDEHSYSPED